MEQGQSEAGVRITMRTKTEQEASRLLAERNQSIGSTTVVKKEPNSALEPRETVDVITNVYQIKMKAPTCIHQYHVLITGHHRKQDGTETTIQLSGLKYTNDYMKSKRRVDSRTIINAACGQNPEVFSTLCAYYDLASLLYTIDPLKLPPDGCIKIEGEPLKMLTINGFHSVRINFEYTKDFNIGDLGHVTGGLSEENKFLEQFLNIATGQEVFYDGANFLTFSASLGYMYNPQVFGFDSEDLIVFSSNNSFLGMGFEKSVRIIEGDKQHQTGMPGIQGSAGLVLEPKKTPFHTSEPLIDKVRALLGYRNETDFGPLTNDKITALTSSLKNLFVMTTYRHAYFPIHSVSNKSSMEYMIPRENAEEISLCDYYKMKRQITLKHPRAPLIQVIETFRGQRQRNYYPIELLVVCEDQRVKGNQSTQQITQDMIKVCAVPPDVLKLQIGYTKNALNLMDESAFLTALEVNIDNTPLEVKAGIIKPPTLAFSQQREASVNLAKSTWPGGNFFMPATCDRWGIYAYNRGRDTLTNEELNKFAHLFYDECRSKGMSIAVPGEIDVFQLDAKELKKQMLRLKELQCQFVLVVHPDRGDHLHDLLKFMEQQTGIVTQGLKTQTVKKLITTGAPVTLQNIIQKTNVKIGGLNFTLSKSTPQAKLILDDETLFIGFGINHPGGGLGISDDSDEIPRQPKYSQKKPPRGNENAGNGNVGNANAGNGNANGANGHASGSSSSNSNGYNGLGGKPPTVIGFSANITGGNPFAFCGGFDFQAFRRDVKVENVAKIVSYCVERYNFHRKHFPKKILIYRNGCGEGQFTFVLQYEIPMIKSELLLMGCDAPLTFIVPNKLQGIRLFLKNYRANARTPAEKALQPGTVIHDTITHPCITEFHLNSHTPLHGTARVPVYTVLVDENGYSLEDLENMTYALCYGHQIVYIPTSIPTPVYVAEEYAKRGRNIYNKWISENGNGMNHANVKEYADLMKILGHQFVESLNSRRVNA